MTKNYKKLIMWLYNFLILSQSLYIQSGAYFFSLYAPCDVILPACARRMRQQQRARQWIIFKTHNIEKAAKTNTHLALIKGSQTIGKRSKSRNYWRISNFRTCLSIAFEVPTLLLPFQCITTKTDVAKVKASLSKPCLLLLQV